MNAISSSVTAKTGFLKLPMGFPASPWRPSPHGWKMHEVQIIRWGNVSFILCAYRNIGRRPYRGSCGANGDHYLNASRNRKSVKLVKDIYNMNHVYSYQETMRDVKMISSPQTYPRLHHEESMIPMSPPHIASNKRLTGLTNNRSGFYVEILA
jgi:hypothetical protein